MSASKHRVHIFGASGSGTSTLGRAIAEKLALTFFDADDYYWQKTNIPYTVKVAAEIRIKTLLADMAEAKTWVLSGSVVSWGDAFIPLFTAAVFVTLEAQVRLERLRQRERQRYGSRIDKGGDMFEIHETFMDWAALYDVADVKTRSLVMHEEWIRRLDCPCIRVESVKPVAVLADEIIEQL